MVNGHEDNQGYYLINGIYPRWSVFVNNIPLSNSKVVYVCCMSVERTEGCRESILGSPRLDAIFSLAYVVLFSYQVFSVIMCACIILHNIITGNECGRSYIMDDYI
jgi:hypothetical protein